MKKPTVTGFLGICAVIFFAVTLLGMCIIVMYTLYRAELDSARWTMGKEAVRAERRIVMNEDGTMSLDDDSASDLSDCYVAIVSADGTVVSGSLPIDQNLVPASHKDHDHDPKQGSKRREGRLRTIKENGTRYYVYDRNIRMVRNVDGSMVRIEDLPPEDSLYLRAVLKSEDNNSVYRHIQVLLFVFVLMLIATAVAGGIWLYRKAALPVRKMYGNIEKIIEDPDYSGLVEVDARFYETDVMKNAYNKLVDRDEKLIRKQEEFNENVSHELRTPVAVIRSESELIRDLYGDKIPEEVAESVSVIHNQTGRINTMISELMYMAKMDRENFSLNKEAMELSDIAESVCDDMEEVTLRGRKFAYHWEPSEAEIDVELVIIAVRNLITNAVKYSPEGSTIDLYSGTEEGGKLFVTKKNVKEGSGAVSERYAYLKVADKGIGISEEDQKLVFNPYYQVKSERNSDGFGLGLSLTMKIAVKHGGTVLLESEQGKGSTFTLVLPV